MLVISAMVVAMFTSIFNIPLDYIFELLFAPTADDMKVKADENTVINQVGRRMSNVAANAINTVRRASATFDILLPT